MSDIMTLIDFVRMRRFEEIPVGLEQNARCELIELERQLKEANEDAERLSKIAKTIFDVSRNAHPPLYMKCPHEISPRYPTHAWWCDNCFGEIESSLQAHEERIENSDGVSDNSK